MANYIRYANQNAGRNLPLDPALIDKLKYLEDMGITAEVFSGGVQPGMGKLSKSGRHVHGGAGDMRFYQGDRRLDWANPNDLPIYKEIVSRGKAAGITGFGAGPGYMEPGSMHVGMGAPVVWGKGGHSDNAPAWLREAYGSPIKGGAATQPIMAAVKSGQIDPVFEVMAAAQGSAGAGISGSANAGTSDASGAATVAAAAQEPTLGDKIGKALFGDKLAADLKGSFGADAKPNPLSKGFDLFAGAFGGGGKSQQQQQAMNIDPSSLGAVEAADAQRSQGAQQLMAALMNNRRRVV